MQRVRNMHSPRTILLTAMVVAGKPGMMAAQSPPPDGKIEQGSANIQLVSHVPLGRAFSVGDIEIEQELTRPYVYVSRWELGGVDILDISTPEKANIIYSWRIENAELHRGSGGTDGKYFKLNGRYYYVQALQFLQGGPDADLGAVVFDVTGLPDPAEIEEVGRIRAPDTPGGFHNVFAYKHSDGRVLLFATTAGPYANIYDMEKFLAGDAESGLISRIPVPEFPCPNRGMSSVYHDFYVAYHHETGQDRFYGASQPVGTYIFDISRPEEPGLLTSVACVPGVTRDHTFAVSPDGRYAVAESHLRYSPIRVYDLEPGLSGKTRIVDKPIGAWTADWKKHAHNLEMRWPYVFVANYMEGMQVFNMMDPTDPYTIGQFDTYDMPDSFAYGGGQSFFTEVANGAMGLDVRNADGLIVVSDFTTGFWAFRMDGFEGWNGEDWGMPNVSTVQDWENGPTGIRRTVFE